MFTKSKITLAAVVVASIFVGNAQAKEVTVEEFVSTMVSQAVQVASQEIQYGVQKAVLTATNSLSFNEEKTYVAKVTITDINVVEAAKNETE